MRWPPLSSPRRPVIDLGQVRVHATRSAPASDQVVLTQKINTLESKINTLESEGKCVTIQNLEFKWKYEFTKV